MRLLELRDGTSVPLSEVIRVDKRYEAEGAGTYQLTLRGRDTVDVLAAELTEATADAQLVPNTNPDIVALVASESGSARELPIVAWACGQALNERRGGRAGTVWRQAEPIVAMGYPIDNAAPESGRAVLYDRRTRRWWGPIGEGEGLERFVEAVRERNAWTDDIGD